MVIMKKPITAITVLIAILSISLPAISQYYEPDTSEIEALKGPYVKESHPQYYEGIEAYFEELNKILSTKNQNQESLLQYTKDNLIGFINVMNAYIANKLKIDDHNTNLGLKPVGRTQNNLSSDDLKDFAEAIALYIDNEKISPDALIKYITNQLESDNEKISPDALIEHITKLLKVEKVIIETNAEAFAEEVIEHMEDELEKIKIDIEDTTILTLHSASPYGRETNDYLNELAKKKGFTHESKKDTEFEWSEFRQKYRNLAFIFVRGGGDMYQETIKEAKENKYLVSKLIGDEWSNSINTLRQISKIADGYKALTYLNETAKTENVYWKLGVWDAYTSAIKSDKLKGRRKAINQACKELFEANGQCTSLGEDTDAMTKKIIKIRTWIGDKGNWSDDA